MGLWDWTLAAYARPGVPEACLMLQDAHGQNTSFLLWAVWAEGPGPQDLAIAAGLGRDWEARVLGPLRTVRRTLKADFPPVDDGARLGLREDVEAAELRAERVLMETFEALEAGKNGAPTLAALTAASAAWGPPAPPDALATLAAALD